MSNSQLVSFDFANRTTYPSDNAIGDIISGLRRNGVPLDNQRADADAYERTRPYYNMTEDRRIERERRNSTTSGGKTKQKKSKKTRKLRTSLRKFIKKQRKNKK
jgi:hypothetical protein